MHTDSAAVNPLDAARVVDRDALVQAISPARLGTYLRRTGGDVDRALDLYVWNAEAGAALHPILQANEVALRNAVGSALAAQFGSDWPYRPGFLRAIPTRSRAPFEGARRAIERGRGGARSSADDVVAAQSYGFWVVLLTARFTERIWSREFARRFPHAPQGIGLAGVHATADALRRLRNRIAHHESLLGQNLAAVRAGALAMVGWISPVKAAWAEARWPVPDRLLRPP